MSGTVRKDTCASASKTETITTAKPNGEVVTVTSTADTDYKSQLAAAITLNSRERKPLFKLTAAPGVPVTGIESIEVYAEDKQVDLPVAPASEFAQGVTAVGGVVEKVTTTLTTRASPN